MRYAILIEKAKSNYSAFAPDMPGCAATGKTLEEVKQHMKEALEFHFEGLIQDGESVPAGTTQCAYIDIDVARIKGLRRKSRVTSR